MGWMFVAALALGGGIARGQTTRPAAPGEVARLIGQLGDGEYSVREAASRRLIELGEAVRPALQAAMAEGDDEVRQRARSVLFAISELTPERQGEIAASVAKAYARADYVSAAREQELLARRRRPTVAQCIAAGNYWQLANRWAQAVAGYQRALERVEQVLAGDPENDPPPAAAEEDNKRFGGGGGRGPGLNGNGIQAAPGLTDFQKRELTQQRAGLILLIGRLQREKLGDGAAAAATFARMVEVVPEFQGDLAALLPALAADVTLRRARKEVKHDVGRGLMILNEFDVMEDLARTQEKLGQTDEAILTLARLCTAYLHTRDDGVDEALGTMSRLIERSPKIAAMAGAAELVKLTPAPMAVEKVAQKREAYANAASPFVWTRTNLGDFKLGAIAVRDFAQLADGRWIAALTAGGRVYTAISADLVTWDAPVELPHNGVANNVEPEILVDGNGTIWLAWFNNRLSLNPRSSGGYVLWLTSSGDAKTWSPPRAIGADTGGWPMGALHWLRTTDRHYRLSWRAAAATAVSPADMMALSPIQTLVPQHSWPMDPHVSQDEDGRYHMVMDDRMRGVTYSTSRDARDWSEPVVLVEKQENGPGMEEPALLLSGARAALIYQVGNDSFLRRGRWSELKNPEGSVQIGGRGAASLLGTRWQRMGDEIVGFAGGEMPWVVRGTVAKVVGR